jgi:glutaredoxin
MSTLRRAATLLCLVLTLPTAACGKAEAPPTGDAGAASPEVMGPAELTLATLAPGTVLRYRDPETGEVGSASDVEAIPPAARRAVVVFDATQAPPAGADFVADLSGAPPWKAKAIRGFAFPPPAPRAAVAEAGSPEVLLFATEWCGYCSKARKTLASLKVPYTELDLERDPAARPRMEGLARKAGVDPAQLQGVPILFIGGKPVVGWDEPTVLRLLGRG